MATYENHPLLSILAARCHFENTGAISYFFYYLQKYYGKEIDYDILDDSLRRLSLGYNILPGKKKTKHKYVPINVMNMIDKTDEVLKSIKPEIANFRNMYEDLSEFCHPNSLGMHLFCNRDENMTINYLAKTSKEGNVFRHHLCISGQIFLILYDTIYEVLKSNEELPIIIK